MILPDVSLLLTDGSAEVAASFSPLLHTQSESDIGRWRVCSRFRFTKQASFRPLIVSFLINVFFFFFSGEPVTNYVNMSWLRSSLIAFLVIKSKSLDKLRSLLRYKVTSFATFPHSKSEGNVSSCLGEFRIAWITWSHDHMVSIIDVTLPKHELCIKIISTLIYIFVSNRNWNIFKISVLFEVLWWCWTAGPQLSFIYGSCCDHRLQKRRCVRKGQSWDRATFCMERALHHFKKKKYWN